MENLDTMYTDATYYESEMRYPTDTKLLWERVEKSYATMCDDVRVERQTGNPPSPDKAP